MHSIIRRLVPSLLFLLACALVATAAAAAEREWAVIASTGTAAITGGLGRLF